MKARILLLGLIFVLLVCGSLGAAQLSLPKYTNFYVPEYGGIMTMPVVLDSFPSAIGGFRLCIVEDGQDFVVTNIKPGAFMDACGWEYLTWRRVPFPDSLNQSFDIRGSNLIEIIGLASANESYSPACYLPGTSAELVTLELQFAPPSLKYTNRNLGCTFKSLYFFWRDCNDNILYSPGLDTIYTADALLAFDENAAQFTEVNYPFPGFGSPDSTCTESEFPRITGFSVADGFLDYLCTNCEPMAVGDVNCDGFHYTMADAVTFSRYFQWGYGVFQCNPGYQVPQTDVNRDGLTLTVADLVVLLQIASGFNLYNEPFPYLTSPETQARGQALAALCSYAKIAPNPYTAEVALSTRDHASTASLKTSAPVAAVYLKLVASSDQPLREEQIRTLSPGATIGSIGDTVTVLWCNLDGRPVCDGGTMELFESTCPAVNIAHSEVVDTRARAMHVARRGALPTEFSLEQNVPNPFNPTTNISFGVPVAAHVTLDVFNVNGQRIISLANGWTEAGIHTVAWHAADASGHPVASGLYFYRLQIGEFSTTRKMLLLK